MKKTPAALVISLVVLTSACSDDWGFGGLSLDFCKNGYITPTAMQISPSSVSLRTGERVTLSINRSSPKEKDFTCYDLPSWSSSNPAVATAQGFDIIAVSPGTAQLTATSGSVSATVSVTVTNIQVAALSITAPSSLLVGQVSQASVTARDNAGNPIAIIGNTAWSSSDTAVLKVSETGALTGRGEGIATLRVTAESREASVSVTVTRAAPEVKFTAISAGFQHTCGIAGGGAVPNGSLICWGNISGDYRLAPSWMITGGRTFNRIEAGLYHACAIATGSETFCFGRNNHGQIGDGSASTRQDPTRVSTTQTFTDLALGEPFSCGLNTQGATYCWGSIANRVSSTPARLDDAPRFRQITAERTMLCGLTDAGEVYCLGVSQQVSYFNFKKIASPVAFTSIASGEYHTCGLTSGGAAYCWGVNGAGEIGGAGVLVSNPTLLPGGLSFRSIAPGGASTCGITTDGSAKCLGSTPLAGSVNGTFYPIPGAYSRPFSIITNGTSHGCGIDNNGAAWCWGLNTDGQVGVGTLTVAFEPVMIVADPLR